MAPAFSLVMAWWHACLAPSRCICGPLLLGLSDDDGSCCLARRQIASNRRPPSGGASSSRGPISFGRAKNRLAINEVELACGRPLAAVCICQAEPSASAGREDTEDRPAGLLVGRSCRTDGRECCGMGVAAGRPADHTQIDRSQCTTLARVHSAGRHWGALTLYNQFCN